MRLHWPVSACSIDLDEIGRFLPRFAAFNPHLHLTVRIGDDDPQIFWPSDPAWSRWRPSEPLPAHWFTTERFAQLVGATIHKDRTAGQPARFVRDFVGQFRGLSSTTKRKAVLGGLGLLRAARLDALLTADGEPDLGRIALLHMSMCDESRPPKPAALGIIGPDHWLAVLGTAIEPASFEYRRRIDDDSTPHRRDVLRLDARCRGAAIAGRGQPQPSARWCRRLPMGCPAPTLSTAASPVSSPSSSPAATSL